MKEVLHITIDVVPVKQVSSAMSLGLINIDQNLRLKIILLGNIIHTIVLQHKLGRDGSEFSVRINISVILGKIMDSRKLLIRLKDPSLIKNL